MMLITKKEIDWSDMDMFGHVNNVAYFYYIQAARVQLWDGFGFGKTYQLGGVGPILAHTECDFKHPLFYPGSITIKTQVTHIGKSSFALEHEIWDQQEQLCATAKDVVVVFDFDKNKKEIIGEAIKAKLTPYLNQTPTP